MIALACASGARPTTLFFCLDLFHEAGQAALLEQIRQSGAEMIEVPQRVFDKLAYRDNPDGWLAIIPNPMRWLAELPLRSPPFVVVAEAVEKPGNLGAILRTADAAGVDAVISSAPLTDWGNPNVVQASKGTLFSIPIAQADNAQTGTWLREKAIQIVVATPQATTVYTHADLRGAVAIVVGTEKHGVSQAWLDQAAVAVRIPMSGRVNSLNVSTATALLIYEVVRQRQAATLPAAAQQASV